MAYIENRKSRLPSILPSITAPVHASIGLPAGCVQCGRILDVSSRKKTNFSGKCFSCEHWVTDGDEVFDEWED